LEEADAAAVAAVEAEKAYTAKIDILKNELNQVQEEQEKSERRQESKLAQMSRARRGSTVRHDEASSELAVRVSTLEDELAHARSVAVVAPVAVGEAMVRVPGGVLLIQRAHHIFAQADKDSDDRLTKREAKAAISGDESLMVLFGFHRMKHFSSWFSSVDKDNDGWLTEHELEEWLLRHHADHARADGMRQQHVDEEPWPSVQPNELPTEVGNGYTTGAASNSSQRRLPKGAKRLSLWPGLDSSDSDADATFVAQPLSQAQAQATYEEAKQQVAVLRTELCTAQEQLASQSAIHEEAMAESQKRRLDSAAKNDEIKGELTNRIASLEDELQGLQCEKDEVVAKQDEAEKALLARVTSLQSDLSEAEDEHKTDLRKQESKLAQMGRARRSSTMRHEEASSAAESDLKKTEVEKVKLYILTFMVS
jgi:hypothetical protein